MNTKVICLLGMIAAIWPNPTLHAQGTVFTYQGRVLDNGTNFNGVGQFKFALVTSTNFNLTATATANLSGKFVTSYTLTSGGNGYTNVPAVTIFGGGGTGATATATIAAGVVTAINPGSAGSGYTNPPTVTLDPPPPVIAYVTYWSNDGTGGAGAEPAAAIGVNVTNGLFSIALGDTTIPAMTAINPALFSQPNLQLRIWFNDGVNGFAALSPIQNLTPSPYAVFANNAGNAVTATTATNALMAATALTAGAVGTGAVNTVSIQSNAVTAAKIADGQVVKSLNGLTDSVTLSTNADLTVVAGGGIVTLGIIATSTNSPNTLVRRNAGGSFSTTNLTLDGNLNLPLTTATAGMINSGGSSLLHGFGTASVFVGGLAGNFTATGGGNTGVGYQSLTKSSTGANNTAVGNLSLVDNATGSFNTAVGVQSLFSITGSANNTAAGYQTLMNATTGHDNTALGFSALKNVTTGMNNLALGASSGTNITTGNYNIHIANGGNSGDTQTIRIGAPGLQNSTYIAGIYNTTVSGAAVYVSSSGQLGVLSSSQKFKEDIRAMGEASDILYALHPVTFRYRPGIDAKGIPQFGLIAEEVEKVDPDLVLHDEEHGIYTVRYEAVNAMLLGEFLKEHRKVEAQSQEIEKLNSRLEKLEQLINAQSGGVK